MDFSFFVLGLIAIYAVIVLVPLVFLIFSIAKLAKKEKIVKVSECMLWWLTLSVLFPKKTAYHGLIRKKIYAWMLVLISPAAFITYAIIGLMKTPTNKELPYEDLLATSREEMVAITMMDDFPEFEYLNNWRDNWDGKTYVRFQFKDKTEVDKFTARIRAKLNTKENFLWKIDSLSTNDSKEFFGSDIVYVFRRGWDTLYVKSPECIKENCTQLQISIGNKAFTLRYEGCYPWNLEYYSNPDSLSKLTNVKFPDYKIVNINYDDYWMDDSWNATLELEKKTTKTFIQSLNKSKNWEKLDDGRYRFFLAARNERDLWEYVYVDPQSKFVILEVSTY